MLWLWVGETTGQVAVCQMVELVNASFYAVLSVLHHSAIFFLFSSLLSSTFSIISSLTMVELGIIALVLSSASLEGESNARNTATFLPARSFFDTYVLMAGVGLHAQTGVPMTMRSYSAGISFVGAISVNFSPMASLPQAKKLSLPSRFFRSTTSSMSAPSSEAMASAANFVFPVRV